MITPRICPWSATPPVFLDVFFNFSGCSQAFLPLKGHWFSRIISFYLLSTLPLGPYPPLALTSTNGWILNLDLSRPFCVLIRLSQVPFVCCVATPMLCFWSPAPATCCRRQFLGLPGPLCKDLSRAFIPENVSLEADHSSWSLQQIKSLAPSFEQNKLHGAIYSSEFPLDLKEAGTSPETAPLTDFFPFLPYSFHYFWKNFFSKSLTHKFLSKNLLGNLI